MPRLSLSSTGVAVGGVVLTLLIKLLLDHFITLEFLFLLFIPAIALSAWYGNWTTGVLATGLALPIACYGLIDPKYSLIAGRLSGAASLPELDWLLTPEYVLGAALFLLEGTLLSALLGKLPFSADANSQSFASPAPQQPSEHERLLAQEKVARTVAETAEQRAAFLAEASKALCASLDADMILTTVAQTSVPFLADYCLIFSRLGETRVQQVAMAHQDEQQQAQWAATAAVDLQPTSPIAQVLKTSSPLLIPSLSATDRSQLDIDRALGAQSLLIVPLRAREQVLGVMQLVMADSKRQYEAADLPLAMELAQRSAIAIENVQLYQQAQALNRLKDEFLATLSHELRTPLHAVLGWAQLLQTRQFDPMTQRAIETIGRNARLQAQLIDDLLDASRIMTGRLRLRPRWTDFASVVNRAIETHLVAAEAKAIQLSFVLEAPVGSLWIDPRYMRQVVWHLLCNAIKFTPSGGQVQVRLAKVSLPEGEFAQLTVTDTGQGISPEFLPFVFDRFRQADGSTTRSYGGLGLGLAIVRYLVELHGGAIDAASPGVGQGATFTLKLPITAPFSEQRLGSD